MEYARDYGLDEEQTEDLIYYVRAMDNAHLKRLKDKQPKKEPPGKKSRVRKGR